MQIVFGLADTKLFGSGGYVIANISPELQKKADLGVGKLFLAPVGKIETASLRKHFCKNCNEEFNSPPKIHLEENNREEVADNLVLVERGQYTCINCNNIIGEYRVFEKNQQNSEIGNAKPEK